MEVGGGRGDFDDEVVVVGGGGGEGSVRSCKSGVGVAENLRGSSQRGRV